MNGHDSVYSTMEVGRRRTHASEPDAGQTNSMPSLTLAGKALQLDLGLFMIDRNSLSESVCGTAFSDPSPCHLHPW